MTKHLHVSEDQLDSAMLLEKAGDLQKAEKAYLKIIDSDAGVTKTYDRLLLIYRKQKECHKELNMVNRALKAYRAILVDKQKQWVSKNKQAAKLSKALALSLGVIDKKGLPVAEDAIITRWEKRKQVILKRLKKS